MVRFVLVVATAALTSSAPHHQCRRGVHTRPLKEAGLRTGVIVNFATNNVHGDKQENNMDLLTFPKQEEKTTPESTTLVTVLLKKHPYCVKPAVVQHQKHVCQEQDRILPVVAHEALVSVRSGACLPPSEIHTVIVRRWACPASSEVHADFVRKRACPSSSEVHADIVRRKACPSSSEEVAEVVREKACPSPSEVQTGDVWRKA